MNTTVEVNIDGKSLPFEICVDYSDQVKSDRTGVAGYVFKEISFTQELKFEATPEFLAFFEKVRSLSEDTVIPIPDNAKLELFEPNDLDLQYHRYIAP